MTDPTPLPVPGVTPANWGAQLNLGIETRKTNLQEQIDAIVGGYAVPGLYLPETYGAVGDGTADDTTAVQDAIDAAFTAGGGTVLLLNEYRITGEIYVKATVGLMGWGVQTAYSPSTKASIKCDSATARVRVGQSGSTQSGPTCHGFQIDGNNTGDPTGVLRVQSCLSRAFRDIAIHDTAGVGLSVAVTQNSTFDNIDTINCGGACWVLDDGAGGNLFLRSEVANGQYGIRFLNTNAVHGGYPYGPGRNLFIDCLFEDYTSPLANGVTLLDAQYGQGNRFLNCAFSASGEDQSSLFVAKVYQGPGAVIQTEVEFEAGCSFFGRNTSDGIYVGAGSRIAVHGDIGFLQCSKLFTTDDSTSSARLNGMSLVSFDYTEIFHATGTGTFDDWTDSTVATQLLRIEAGDGIVNSRLQYKNSEIFPRRITDADGIEYYGDGVAAYKVQLGWNSTADALSASTPGLATFGRWSRPTTTVTVASDQAVALDVKARSSYLISLGANITALTTSNETDGTLLTLFVSVSATGKTITWGSAFQLKGNLQPVTTNGSLFTIEFKYYGNGYNKWVEISRREKIAQADAVDATTAAAISALLTTTITDGDTTHAPDGNSVFDALVTATGDQGAVFTSSSFPAGAISLGSFLAGTYAGFRLVLAGNVTFSATARPSAPAGRSYEFFLCLVQDGTGSRTLTLNANILKPNGMNTTLTTTAGAMDLLQFRYTGTELILTDIYKNIA